MSTEETMVASPPRESLLAQNNALKSCRVCYSVADHPVFVAREMMYGTREEFEYFQCRACGCLQITNIPENLGDYYRSDYYSIRSDHAGFYGNALKNWLNRLRDHITLFAPGGDGFPLAVNVPSIRAAYSAIRRTPGLRLRSRIVDVGCGSGQLLYRMRNAGFSNLVGIDPFLKSDQFVDESLRFKRCDLAELDGEFDLIMMHHSFEHVATPVDTIARIHALLAPNGVALIRIPVVDSAAWAEYQTDWFQLDAPRHLYLHTQASMKKLAKRAGLKILNSYCDSDEHQFVVSEKYRLGIPMILPAGYTGPRFHASAEQMKSYQARASELNRLGQGDQAVFFLTRDTAEAA